MVDLLMHRLSAVASHSEHDSVPTLSQEFPNTNDPDSSLIMPDTLSNYRDQGALHHFDMLKDYDDCCYEEDILWIFALVLSFDRLFN